jgi:S-adenosylmethionine hydrolase
MSHWQPSGIVTLTTDYGITDPYVGLVKGVLLSEFRGVTSVDVTHAVPPQSVAIGAWMLAHAWPWFPAGSVHLAVVDPGVGSARRLLVAHDHGHAFVGPDNGLLAAALSPAAQVFELDVARFARAGASRTFHGRDIMAPAAARIARGTPPGECGPRLAGAPVRVELPLLERLSSRELRARVLFADHFGNLVLNVGAGDLAGAPEAWSVEAAGRAIPVVGAYAEVAPGELCALVDSYGALEIAQRDGNAAERLQLSAGAPVTMRNTR